MSHPQRTDASTLNRRSLLSAIAAGTALASTVLALPAAARDRFSGASDLDILNFALNLEYLEAEFYAYATTGAGIPAEFTTGRGTAGATTGGVQTTFTDTLIQNAALELAADEFDHVAYLRAALGNKAVAKPAITLNPLGDFNTQPAFLTYARAFEDVGVSAYASASRFIDNQKILFAAARILAVEAYHAGNIRLHAVQQGLTLNALDEKDQPPTPTNFFPTFESGLAPGREFEEVLAVVAPFFPNGLNGKIRVAPTPPL